MLLEKDIKFMKGKTIMEIKINKTSENEIMFFMNENSYDFSFDNISKIIDYSVEHQEETINVTDLTEEKELSSYKQLIEKVIVGSRTEDFIAAVKNANAAKTVLKDAENKIV